jgi:hypothetical protein
MKLASSALSISASSYQFYNFQADVGAGIFAVSSLQLCTPSIYTGSTPHVSRTDQGPLLLHSLVVLRQVARKRNIVNCARRDLQRRCLACTVWRKSCRRVGSGWFDRSVLLRPIDELRWSNSLVHNFCWGMRIFGPRLTAWGPEPPFRSAARKQPMTSCSGRRDPGFCLRQAIVC